MKKEIFALLFILAHVTGYARQDCRDRRGRLVCLHVCGWRSAPNKRCFGGKQCCILKPRNVLYQSIKENMRRPSNSEISGSKEVTRKPQSYNNWLPPVFAWLTENENSSKQSWLNQKKKEDLKLTLPLSKFPWTTSLDDDTVVLPRPRPNRNLPTFSLAFNDIDSSFEDQPHNPSSRFVKNYSNELKNNVKITKKHPRIVFEDQETKVILNPDKYIKPKMSSVNKTTLPMRKSAKYCELYSKMVKRNIKAMPLLPYSHPYAIEVDDCGPSFTPLIVGGKPVQQQDFPHMTALGYHRGGDIDYLCGGSLISESFVLTAAHCTKTRWGAPVLVHLGSSELYSENATTIKVDLITVHPDYVAPSCYNDIALVKLSSPPNFTPELRPACLPAFRTHAQLPGETSIATGWGKLGFGRESSLSLMQVSLKIIDNSKCKEFYISDSKTTSLKFGITPSMVCAAGYKSSFHDTCQGDSGGPLQALKEGSKCMMEVIGITSFGKSCGSGVPAVYTRVSYYLDWIERVVWP